MSAVIGLDFGNYNVYASYIQDIDMDTRMGGIVHDLVPADSRGGIPSVYFYSKRVGKVLIGKNAVKRNAIPVKNQLRYLKRYLDKTVDLDRKMVAYKDSIVEVVQHCIRIANKQLFSGYQITTNLVSLSYPATYTCAQKERLVQLVEKATLEDGTHVKVFGTIQEPAAAALDYCASFIKDMRDKTVLTYDLGGGTFDLALLAAYPAGKKRSDGSVYYYDVINTRGIGDLGGVEFDAIMYDLLLKKASIPIDKSKLTNEELANLKIAAEDTKVELSNSDEEMPQVVIGGEYVDFDIKRKEYEQMARPLVRKTVEATVKIIEDHPNQKPDVILLTGGASQMPLIKEELERALPEYKGKILPYRPNEAISYGAARFGTVEAIVDPNAQGGSQKKSTLPVQNRLTYDLGVRFIDSTKEGRPYYIHAYLKAGTVIPCESELVPSWKVEAGRCSSFTVFEANKNNPDSLKIDQDYIQIMNVEIDHGRIVPAEHPHESRMVIDERGLLTIEARDKSAPNLPFVKAQKELQNLSEF